MSRETNRLLEKKHCPLFRQRLQPLIKYYKLLTSMVISFQANRITVRKFLTPPEGEEGHKIQPAQDTAIDAFCFENVCKRLGCHHCYEPFTDEEYSEAVALLRKDSRAKSRPTPRKKSRKSTEDKTGIDVKVR